MTRRSWPRRRRPTARPSTLKPDYAEAYNNLGVALRRSRRTCEAEAAYRKAIELKPELAEAHCKLGHALRKKGELRQALEEMRRGHELGSKVPGWKYPSASGLPTSWRAFVK